MLMNELEANSETSLRSARLEKMVSVEWVGQTVASLCWICSVFAYGISSTGDWLQLCAASAWLLANVSSILSSKP
ncbi:MAG: hypothetical protein AAGG48_23020 [Planctomycetota bacterium]